MSSLKLDVSHNWTFSSHYSYPGHILEALNSHYYYTSSSTTYYHRLFYNIFTNYLYENFFKDFYINSPLTLLSYLPIIFTISTIYKNKKNCNIICNFSIFLMILYVLDTLSHVTCFSGKKKRVSHVTCGRCGTNHNVYL